MSSGFRSKGKGSKRHLRPSNKPQNAFNASNSANWRDAKLNGLDSISSVSSTSSSSTTNYGYTNHHLTSAFFSLIGLKIQIQKVDGDIYEGLLETVSTQLEVHLSHPVCVTNVSSKKPPENENLSYIIPFCDIVYFKAVGVDLDFGKRDAVSMDNDVGRANGSLQTGNRELIQWDSGDTPTIEGISGSLEELEMNGNCMFDFNEMMRVNEEQHGVKSTFDESMSTYMTPIETKDTEEHRELEMRAEKAAREIQNETTFQEHELVDSGQNEEEMFSAVVRTSYAPVSNHTTTQSTAINGSVNPNDNFIPARSKSRKSYTDNPVGPRLRQQSQMQRMSDQHNSSSRSYYNSGSPHKNQNGNYSRSSYQSHQGIHASPSKNHHSNMGGQMQGKVDLHQSSRTLYSTIAMKQQANGGKRIPGQSNMPPQKQPPISPQPLMDQSPMLPVSGDVQPPTLPNNSFIPKEALAAAKAEVIQNSKNYASIANPVPSATASNHPVVTQVNSAKLVSEKQHIPVTASSSVGANSRSPLLSSASIPPLPMDLKARGIESLDLKSEQRGLPSQTIPSGSADITAPGTLMKFGKIIHTASHDEEKNSSDIAKDLKEFSDKFKLSESNTQTSKRSAPKTSEVPNRPRASEKDVKTSAISSTTLTEPQASLAHTSSTSEYGLPDSTHQTSLPMSSTVTSAISSAVTCVAVTNTKPSPTESKPLETSVVTSSKLNAAAKEFNPTSKIPLTKQVSYTGVPPVSQQQGVVHPAAAATPNMQYVSQHQPHYYSIQPHATPISIPMNPHEGVQQPHQVQPMNSVKPVYSQQRQPYYSLPHGATVYSIQTSDLPNNPNHSFPSNPNGQSGFIQHPNGPVILMPGANTNPYQQTLLQQNQQIFMPSQFVRYASQPQGGGIQHHQKHYHQPDGQMQGNVVFVNHQNSNYPPPSPSPSHMGGTHTPGQPYVVNQSNTPYQPIASPINHAQGGAMYRPPTPISMHQQLSQQQGQLLMVAQQGGGGNLQAVQMPPHNHQAYMGGGHGYHQV